MGQLTSWLASVVAAAIPTGAIIWQMVQQGEGLRQQLVALRSQEAVMQEQVRLEEQRQRVAEQAREQDLRLQAVAFVVEHIAVIDQGSPTAQRQLARLLTQSFPPEVACPFVEDWIATSVSRDHWLALQEGALPCIASPPPQQEVASAPSAVEAGASAPGAVEAVVSAPGAVEAVASSPGAVEAVGECGLIFLHYVEASDQERARSVASQLRGEGCEVRGPTLAGSRPPGVYGPAAEAKARADQLRASQRRHLEAFGRAERIAAEAERVTLEIVLPNL